MKQKLNHISMKRGSDTEILFEILTSLEVQYGIIGNSKEAELIAITFHVVLDKYQAVLTSE
jgi:hypothetical protein